MKTEKELENVVSSSEVARSLFSETWRSYMDEVSMAAVKLNKKSIDKIKPTKESNSAKKYKGPIRLSLVD
jgi:hypothetical protein